MRLLACSQGSLWFFGKVQSTDVVCAMGGKVTRTLMVGLFLLGVLLA